MTRTIPILHPAAGGLDREDKVPIRFCIKADLLIPGRGEPVNDACVVIEDDKIKHVSRTIDTPSAYSNYPTTHVPVLMPGMWDSHLHYLGATSHGIGLYANSSQALAGARAAADVARTLNAGFTSVRELAGYGNHLDTAIREGQLVGPNIYSSVCAISQTGGHGDAHDMPMYHLKDVCAHGIPLCIADGVSECRRAVREQVRAGAKVIKVAASGGVLSQIDDPDDQQFSDEELRVMVEEAGRTGKIVAAHAHGKAGIMAALRAGCMTIEHGTKIDEECAALMKDKGAMLIATSLVFKEGVKHPELFSPESYAKMLETAKYHEKAYALAVKMGVKIALGTDLGISIPNTSSSHGRDAHELQYAIEAGMTPLQAIEAITANGPDTLGPRFAPKSGQIKEGYDADLIAVSKDPTEDVMVLADTSHITHVWKGGKVFKEPGVTCELR